MIRYLCLILTLSLGVFICDRSPGFSTTASANGANPVRQPLLRIAIVGLLPVAAANEPAESALAKGLGRDPRVALVDQAIIQPALAGIGYDGSINMAKEEARKIGGAIGCDFFIIGKSEAITRSTHEKESHEEAYAGVMIVDARTGALTAFDFISNRASTKDAALQGLTKDLDARASGYVDRMIQLRAQSLKARPGDSLASDLIEDLPRDDSPRSAGFKQPEFLNRVKPEYTTDAEGADITATVEAMVVFRSNGEVGGVEITRWAGFGLDESSERAIRQWRFELGALDGRAMMVWSMRR